MPFCSECGYQVNAEAKFCRSCGAALSGSPALETGGSETVQQIADSEVAAGQPNLASLGRRFGAHLLDAIVVAVLFWMIGSQVAETVGGSTASGFELEGTPALVVILLTFVASLFYMSLTEGLWNGQSLGKKLMGIAVVGEDGKRCRFSQALKRNILRLVDGFALYIVGLVLAWRSEKNQRFGDRMAGTLVVRLTKGAKRAADADDAKARVRFSMGTGSSYVDT